MTALPLFPDLGRRADLPEKMDLPCSDRRELENTLIQFGAVNRFLSRRRFVLQRFVLDAMQPDRRYHLLDLGAGACETAAWLLGRSRRQGLNLRVTACDHDSRVVSYARKNFGGTPGLEILHRDIVALDGLEDADFVFANHLLHHLSDRRIVELIEYLADFRRATLLLNDLRRSRSAYTAYYLLSPLLFRRSFARYDGLMSIRKGFLRSELLRLVRAADPLQMDLYRVEEFFPARVLLLRRPPSVMDR